MGNRQAAEPTSHGPHPRRDLQDWFGSEQGGIEIPDASSSDGQPQDVSPETPPNAGSSVESLRDAPAAAETPSPSAAFAHETPVAPTATYLPTAHAAGQRDHGSGHGRVGRYRLEEPLGKGGFGIVYRAFDPELSRDVAVKILRAERDWEEDAIERFVEEGRKLARLRHPSVVTVYDVGADAGRRYIVTELIDGGTLADRIRDAAPLPPAEAAELVALVADALHQAHLAGIVHRDVKPSNILLSKSGKPFITDFGIAATEEEQLSEGTSVVGTRGYMSPEQLSGASHWADPRCDIYGLGLVLYEALTGRLPFRAKTFADYRDQVLNREPRPPRTLRDTIPASLEAVCLKCLARHPSDRYSTAADLATALRAAVVPAATGVRRPAVFAASALLAGVILAVGAWAMSGGSLPRKETSPNNGAANKAAADAPANAGDQLALRDTGPAPPGVNEARLVDPDAATVERIDWNLPESSTWDIAEADHSVRVYSEDMLLLKLGRLEAQSLDFEAHISMKDSPGRLGLFWGYRPDPQNRTRVLFENVELRKNLEGNWGVSTSLRSVNLKFPQGPGNRMLAWIPLPDFNADRNHLAIRIRDGQVVSCAFNGEDLPGFPAKHYRGPDAEGRTAEGIFGLFAWDTIGRFSEVQVDGKQMRLTKGTP